jgi:ribosomal protein L37AE/L43A
MGTVVHMTYTSQITSKSALAAAKREQAKHEIAECPTCHGAVHPMVLASLGQCTTCQFTGQSTSIR